MTRPMDTARLADLTARLEGDAGLARKAHTGCQAVLVHLGFPDLVESEQADDALDRTLTQTREVVRLFRSHRVAPLMVRREFVKQLAVLRNDTIRGCILRADPDLKAFIDSVVVGALIPPRRDDDVHDHTDDVTFALRSWRYADPLRWDFKQLLGQERHDGSVPVNDIFLRELFLSRAACAVLTVSELLRERTEEDGDVVLAHCIAQLIDEGEKMVEDFIGEGHSN